MSTVNPSGVDVAPPNRHRQPLSPDIQEQWSTTAHPPQYSETLDSFADLRINGSSGLNAYNADPIQRAPSAMSLRSAHSATRQPVQPRHAATLPPSLSYGYDDQGYTNSDVGSSRGSYGEFDQQQNYYHYDDPAAAYYQQQPQHPQYPPQSQYPPQHPPQQSPYPQQHPQQQQQWQVPPPPQGYNQFHAVASDILGMGPPPIPQMARHPLQPPSDNRSIYAGSVSSGHSGNSLQFPGAEFEGRPSYQRSGTSASLTPSSAKSKAIDLKSPPYTKDYIDQYRQRIKGDPDPEAHFLYAKYLIDAAKHIRTAYKDKDERAAKKYSEVLIGESLKVIRRLATQGNAYDEAQFFLANCHGTGALGLQVDHERAYHLYLQAAKQNHAAASYRVAVCNDIGAGTKKDPNRAAAFYRKAASLGDTPAMYKLGTILLHGLLEQQKNPREAIGWLKRAAEQADEDNPHALHELALLYEHKSDQPVPYDPAYAKVLLTQAGQLGYTRSQYKLGQCYEYGTLSCPVDPKRSIAWYTKAAEKNDPEAELALSGWYLTGSEGVLKQSDNEAYLWARKAANKCLAKAEYAVGYYTEVGIGTKPDVESAKKWYMHAAAQGHAGAMNRLTELKQRGAARRQMGRPTRQQAKDECVIC